MFTDEEEKSATILKSVNAWQSILNRLEEYEDAYEQRSDFRTSKFVDPKAPSSIKFIRESKLIINHLLVQNESIEDVSKAFRIPQSNLQECMRYYFTRKDDKMKAYKNSVHIKMFKQKFISLHLEHFLKQRKGMYTPVKAMVSHLKSRFEHLSQFSDFPVLNKSFINPKSVTKVLKTVLRYSWRANTVRAPKAYDPKNVRLRKAFPRLFAALDKIRILPIYVDECTVDPSNLSLRSWQPVGIQQPLKRVLSNRVNLIAAYITKQKVWFMVKKGSTKTYHIKRFFNLLDDKLTQLYTSEYKFYTIFIMDNAKVHVSKAARRFFKESELTVITLPPYTPELNKVERTFFYLKASLKKQDFEKSRLEKLVIDAIIGLKQGSD